jgi:hypothetical protein
MALDYLERSFDAGDTQLLFLQVDTRWDNLRTGKRCIDLITRMRTAGK